MLGLRRAVDEVEQNIAGARRAYDSALTAYNDAIRTFPGSLVARVAGFRALGIPAEKLASASPQA